MAAAPAVPPAARRALNANSGYNQPTQYGTYGTARSAYTGGTIPWVCPHELGSPGMLLASLGFICMPRGIDYRARARRMMLRPGIVEGIAMRFVVGDGGASQLSLIHI